MENLPERLPDPCDDLRRNPLVYKGERVLTFALIDELHGREPGTTNQIFRRNRKHFVRDEDYFQSTKSELGFSVNLTENPKGGRPPILLTQSGYLMVVKSLTDDLAWRVQRMLVNTYFVAQSLQIGEQIDRIGETIRDGLMPIFERTWEKTSEIGDKVDRLADAQSETQAEVEEIKTVLGEMSKRKTPTKTTKARHRRSLQQRGLRNCPCCGVEPIFDEFYNPLDALNWDHWHARHRAHVNDVWPICKHCNQRLKDPAFKDASQIKFQAHQQWVRDLPDLVVYKKMSHADLIKLAAKSPSPGQLDMGFE